MKQLYLTSSIVLGYLFILSLASAQSQKEYFEKEFIMTTRIKNQCMEKIKGCGVPCQKKYTAQCGKAYQNEQGKMVESEVFKSPECRKWQKYEKYMKTEDSIKDMDIWKQEAIKQGKIPAEATEQEISMIYNKYVEEFYSPQNEKKRRQRERWNITVAWAYYDCMDVCINSIPKKEKTLRKYAENIKECKTENLQFIFLIFLILFVALFN